jgi:hypothetical protein
MVGPPVNVQRRAFLFSMAVGADSIGVLAVIRMTVAPGPILALFRRRQLAEIAIRPVRFDHPLAVIDDLMVVPSQRLFSRIFMIPP